MLELVASLVGEHANTLCGRHNTASMTVLPDGSDVCQVSEDHDLFPYAGERDAFLIPLSSSGEYQDIPNLTGTTNFDQR
jgi:hypothetical protein